ncbi:MAG: hypothetical protein HY663_03990 [Chloroflexi bacterium]|nr:hypothetical protein [Chloroflexota bacterium]
MRKNLAWLLVSGLMTLSVVLASCAPKIAEEKKAVTEEKKAVTEEKKVVAEKKEVVAEKEGLLPYQKVVPQYGGTISIAEAADADSVHQATTSGRSTTDETLRFVTDLVAGWDRTRGPASTGEWAGLARWFQSTDLMVGLLAERFEIIQPDTIIFHVRKGVRWQDKPPVNGREMTADDFVFTFRRQFGTAGVMQNLSYPFLSDMKNVANSIYIDPNDPWAVVIKTIPGQMAYVWETTADHISIDPIEYDKYPRQVPPTWKEVVGTGPFFWADYVRGSSMTYERNPNHWQKDPLYPQNQ